MSRSPRRPAARAGYHVEVGGLGGSSERIDLDEEGDLRAVKAAFGATSDFGHALGQGRRLLGYFEPGEGRTPHAPRRPEGSGGATRPPAAWR